MYKIIAKIIVKRLKVYLPNIISPNQSAFIGKRQIVDNFVLAHEFIHLLENKIRGKQKYMALKLDKLKLMIELSGFIFKNYLLKWTSMKLYKCMTTPTYKFLY